MPAVPKAANIINYIVLPENSFTTGFRFDLSGGRATYYQCDYFLFDIPAPVVEEYFHLLNPFYN
jgi:hypothetical protein